MIHRFEDKLNDDGSLVLTADLFLNQVVAKRLEGSTASKSSVTVNGEQMIVSVTFAPTKTEAQVMKPAEAPKPAAVASKPQPAAPAVSPAHPTAVSTAK